MAPRHQHTFTLVPNPVGGMQGLMSRANAPQSDKPPMTSKQAQKLYRESTRGPRLSKAEQRRLEREEQDRIRRELDKEMAANRARALREKKKDKERLAMEEKRKKGLPLVSARSSQDTIARFVRGNGMGKKRDAVGEKVGDLPAVREESVEDGNPVGQTAGASQSKRRRLDIGLQDGNHAGNRADVRPGETDRIEAEQGKENTKPKSLDKGVDISVKAVEFSGGRDPVDEPRAPEPDRGQEKEDPVSARTNQEKPKLEERKGPETKTRPVEKPRAEEPVTAKNTRETSKPEEKERPEAKVTPAEKTRAEDGQPGAVESRLRPAGNTTRANPLKAADEGPAKEAPTTNSPAISPLQPPPLRQRTPVQGIPGQVKANLATPKPLPKGLAQSPMPKTSFNKQAQTPNPPARSVPPPQQQRPSKPAQAQQPPARKVLQETTNSLNRMRSVSATASAARFASPYKSALATPRRQHPTTAPAFKQPRPQTLAGELQKPQFHPPHLRSAAARQRPASPAPTTKPRPRSAHDDFMSAPPTSTQLFVMSHIDDDDLFPSPTQEARELRGDAPPAVTRPAKPIHTPSRMPAPVAGFATKSAARPRPLMRQVTRVTAAMAPPPCPAVVKPATKKPAAVTKPTEAVEIPFISTQDLLFSSQDLRDLEEPMTTPSKIGGTGGNYKPPPFKPRPSVQRPWPLSRPLPPKPVQLPTPQFRTKTPAFSGKQLPTSASVDRRPQQACEQGTRCPEQTSVPKNQQAPENNSVPSPCPNSPKGKDGPPSPGPRHPSPEKRRYFDSSGTEAEVLLALGRSRKTHQEEERRRVAERAGQQGGNHSAECKQIPGQQKERVGNKSPEPAPGAPSGSPHRRTPSLPQGSRAARSQTESMADYKAAAAGDQTTADTACHAASQETDYGDVELDMLDFDELITITN